MRTRLTAQADGGSGLSQSLGMPKRILEASTTTERAKQRQKLGTLRELTVQPATKRRYDLALQGFLQHLRDNDLDLPRNKNRLDPLVCDYIEFLWFSGKGRGLACDTLASLQDAQPSVKGSLPGAWRLLKTWHVNEVPNRAPPLPQHVVHAMAGWAFFNNWNSFGVSLLIGFYSMLRTGELLKLRAADILCSGRQRQALISLGLTKSGRRQGAAESVVLGYELAVKFTEAWKSCASAATALTPPPAKWRHLFSEALKALNLTKFEFRPYSLRRGGATFFFQQHQSMDRILIQGRWQTQKTARVYLNEGLAVLAQMQLPADHPDLKPFLSVFQSLCKSPKFRTLEPPPVRGRTGGRGRSSKNKSRRAGKALFPERSL